MSPEKKATINHFGKAVATLLDDRRRLIRMTQAQLAEKTGISQSQLSKQLRGIRAINMDEFGLLCNALGLNMAKTVSEIEDSLTLP